MGIEVVASELHTASASLADAAQRLRDGLSGVHDEVTDLLGTGWKGGAASAYAPVWDRWNEGAGKVAEGLQRMSELLDIAGRDYARTDESAAQSIGTTSSATGGASPGATGDPVATDAGGASSTAPQGASSAGGAAAQALGTLPQLGQTATQPLSQAGQAVGGVIQAALQLAAELAERVEEATEAEAAEEAAEKAADEKSDGAAVSGARPSE